MASEAVFRHGVRVGRVEVGEVRAAPVGVSVEIAFRPEWPGMWDALAREVKP